MANFEDLARLFLQQNETLSTEFKSWLDLDKAEGRANLAKAAIALANHGGGAIVLGMREAAGLIGSSPSPFSRYTTDAVNAAVNNYAEPKIHCEVVHLPHPATGFEHCFVVVPGPHPLPIMSKKDCLGVIASQKTYIRKPGPKSEEPFTAEEWRALFAQNMQANRDAISDSIRTILYGLPPPPASNNSPSVDRLKEFNSDSKAKWESLVKPLAGGDIGRATLGRYEFTFEIVGATPAPSLKELNHRLNKASELKLTGWNAFVNLEQQPHAPAAVDGVIEAWVGNPLKLGRQGNHVDFWRVHPDGRLFQLRAFDEDFRKEVSPGRVLSLTTPIWRLGDALLFVARLAKEWEGSAIIRYRTEYFGLRGRTLKVLERSRMVMSYDRISQADTVMSTGETTVTELENNTEEVLAEALAPLYEAFDFYTIPMEIIIQEVAKLKAGRF